jgi:hypothetical protein
MKSKKVMGRKNNFIKKVQIILLLFFLCNNIQATNVSLQEIKDSLLLFLDNTNIRSESYYEKYRTKWSNELIRDTRVNKRIEDGMNGVFLFGILSEHEYLHFVLIDDSGFEIVNMKNPLDENIKMLKFFLKRNLEYTKKDVRFYIKEFRRIKKYNKQAEQNGLRNK